MVHIVYMHFVELDGALRLVTMITKIIFELMNGVKPWTSISISYRHYFYKLI